MPEQRSLLARGLRKARRVARRVTGASRSDPVILMYHRIASPPYDPWGLCVSPEDFRDQLSALTAARTLLSMSDLVDGLKAGDLPPGAIAITFDDGYADNAVVAKPILDELAVPASFFLTTGFVDQQSRFWWDELAELVLGGRRAADFTIEHGGLLLAGCWPAQEKTPEDLQTWRYTHQTCDPRRMGYMTLWGALQSAEPPVREFGMEAIRELLGEANAAETDALARSMTREEALSLTQGTTAIGGHGRSHAPLPRLGLAEQWDEIAGGRSDLVDLCDGTPPEGFAFPHGEYTRDLCELVERAGYRWAVTTDVGRVNPKSFDRFALPRLAVGRTRGEELLRSIDRI